MRSVTPGGYPIIGRKANGRENVPAQIYWMLAHGAVEEDEIVVPSCNSRLCVNPDHARVVDRRARAAVRMRQVSALDWDAVHEIRQTLPSSREGMRDQAAALATRFGVREPTILAVFRTSFGLTRSTRRDSRSRVLVPAVMWSSAARARCASTKTEECCAAAMAARTAGKRRHGSHGRHLRNRQGDARERRRR